MREPRTLSPHSAAAAVTMLVNVLINSTWPRLYGGLTLRFDSCRGSTTGEEKRGRGGRGPAFPRYPATLTSFIRAPIYISALTTTFPSQGSLPLEPSLIPAVWSRRELSRGAAASCRSTEFSPDKARARASRAVQ